MNFSCSAFRLATTAHSLFRLVAQANAGFAHEYQLVNVEDYQGVGESQPFPYFYQNLGEAEYVVATYQYMRLMGSVRFWRAPSR